MGIEDGRYQQQHQYSKDHIGEGVIDTVIHQQDNQSQYEGSTNPDNLHTRTTVKTEDIRFAIGIAGTTNADPAKSKQS